MPIRCQLRRGGGKNRTPVIATINDVMQGQGANIFEVQLARIPRDTPSLRRRRRSDDQFQAGAPCLADVTKAISSTYPSGSPLSV